MSFRDINDPAKRATLVKEYVTTMKTVKQRNMKLAIGDELQTLFYLIVNATKQVTDETRKEFARWSFDSSTCYLYYKMDSSVWFSVASL